MKRTILFYLLLFLLLPGGWALAQDYPPAPATPVVLTDSTGKFPLGLHMEYLEDPTGELTIEQVSSPEYAGQFTPSQLTAPNFGYTNSAYWVRFTLDNQTLRTVQWLLEVGFPNMQYVDLYSPHPSGEGFQETQSGNMRPLSNRDVIAPYIVFNLNTPLDAQQTYYLRFLNGGSMTLGMTLWSTNAYVEASQVNLLLHGVFFGTLLALAFYNLFLLFSLREMPYLLYVGLMMAVLFQQFSYLGYMQIYIIPNWYFFGKYVLGLSLAAMIVMVILFSDNFLKLRTQFPTLHRINQVLLVGWAIASILLFFFSYHTVSLVMMPLSLISVGFAVAAGILSWKRKYRPARFFLLAWLFMLASMILVIIVRLGILPSTPVFENAYVYGLTAMAICWAIALADRINLLKAETETANRSLKANQSRLTQILDSLQIGVVLYGKDRLPRYINRRSEEILSNPEIGRQADPAARRTLAEALQYFSIQKANSPDLYPLESFPLSVALSGESTSADDIVMDRGDRQIPLEFWASPILDDQGNVEAAIAAFQDITTRKQSEAELFAYRDHLENLVQQRNNELKHVNEQLQLRLDWVSAVYQLHQSITGQVSLQRIYSELAHKIRELMQARLVFTIGWEKPADPIYIHCSIPQGETWDEIQGLPNMLLSDSPLWQACERGTMFTWHSEGTPALPPELELCFTQHAVSYCLFAPMSVRQTVVGLLGVVPSLQDQFSEPHINLIERMAFDMASLAQDAILIDQAYALAALEERNRLARDLHDSVTQVLFSANLLAEVLPQVWRRDPEEGLRRLEKLHYLNKGALAEMRAMLLELRPTSVSNIPLSDLLTQLAEATTSRSGVNIVLEIEKGQTLPEPAHTNIYRIAQEALNNVVKHSQANKVVMILSTLPSPTDKYDLGGINLLIADDGVGFSTECVDSTHLGIGIMTERAQAIHAELTLESEPGHGTLIGLVWRRELRNPS